MTAVMSGPVLRPYQQAAIDALFAWVAAHDGHPLLVLPTGAGKSLVMGSIVQRVLDNAPGARVLLLAHRKELIQQNVKAVASVLPLAPIGIYSAGLKQRDTTSPIIVAGIQSIARKPYAAGAFDLILIDESHLVPSDDATMYRKFIDAAKLQNPHVRFAGLTATPYRLDVGMLHEGKNALFTGIAYDAPVSDLIRDGYLCPLISKATLTQLDTSGVQMRGGEFVPGQLEAAVDTNQNTAGAVAEMLELFATRNKWLIFCAGVQHAEHVADALRAKGIAADCVHGELSADERAQRLRDFKHGRLRALTSMDVLTTGYDEPAIDAIALLRPTKSTGLYCQMVGRGLRLHPSKTNTLVLDFAGNVAQHGPVDQVTPPNGSRKSSGDSETGAPTKVCAHCKEIVALSARTCSACGAEFPPPPPKPILPFASDLPILSTEPKPTTWSDVTEVQYYYHSPREEGKLPTLRVEYFHHYRLIAREWVCFEHTGFPREKAEYWWRHRSTEPVPDTIEEALRLTDSLLTPSRIATQPDGRWTKIVDTQIEMLEPDELPPAPHAIRSCWSCRFFRLKDGFCRQWDATPPTHAQATGCDAHVDSDVPF